MNNKFDELTKSLAQSVTRRAALKKFGVGVAGMALACFGLANKAAAKGNCFHKCMQACVRRLVANGIPPDEATNVCTGPCEFQCAF